MEKVFTLEELKQIKKEYNSPDINSFFLCDESSTFRTKYYLDDKTREKIVSLAKRFISGSNWISIFNIDGEFYLFRYSEVYLQYHSRNNSQVRQIRIEFLDWLIENTES